MTEVLEYISDRLRAMLAEQQHALPAAVTEHIRMLEAEVARLSGKLLEKSQADTQLAEALPLLSTAVKECGAKFSQLIVGARAEVPPAAQAQIADLEKRLSAALAERDALKKERDEAVVLAQRLEVLRDGAVRWHKDNYSPRFHSVIDMFLRAEVANR